MNRTTLLSDKIIQCRHGLGKVLPPSAIGWIHTASAWISIHVSASTQTSTTVPGYWPGANAVRVIGSCSMDPSFTFLASLMCSPEILAPAAHACMYLYNINHLSSLSFLTLFGSVCVQ